MVLQLKRSRTVSLDGVCKCGGYQLKTLAAMHLICHLPVFGPYGKTTLLHVTTASLMAKLNYLLLIIYTSCRPDNV